MERYRIFVDKRIDGPFEIAELLALEGFCENSLVCQVGEDSWLPAGRFQSLRYHFMVKAGKIGVGIPAVPTTGPSDGSSRVVSPWRVSQSGDFMGPDFQLNAQRIHQKPRLTPASSRTTAITSIPVAHPIPLPQPRLGPHKLTVFVVWLLLTGGLWAMAARAGLPELVQRWWATNPLAAYLDPEEVPPPQQTVKRTSWPHPRHKTPSSEKKAVSHPSRPNPPKQKSNKPWFSDRRQHKLQ